MLRLKNEYCQLRALEPDDLNFLLKIENDESLWKISNTQIPFSKYLLTAYLKNAGEDIYAVKQLRLVICLPDGEAVGLLDFFDFEPKHKRAGIGIVLNELHRNKGIGNEVLSLVKAYARDGLDLHQIYANIGEHNSASLKLFEKSGFRKTGTKIDWIYDAGSFENEIMVQLIFA
ncbi:MAG: GNAT family N-acetyltransferase [Flavobacteriaceae bacterium]|nr:GNAT family N-acetyltransferase [Flavobacteriaceae bacterium]MDZ4148399.1 GNAT family N-acetyltransferase [Flavobacteriaceae bacterium]